MSDEWLVVTVCVCPVSMQLDTVVFSLFELVPGRCSFLHRHHPPPPWIITALLGSCVQTDAFVMRLFKESLTSHQFFGPHISACASRPAADLWLAFAGRTIRGRVSSRGWGWSRGARGRRGKKWPRMRVWLKCFWQHRVMNEVYDTCARHSSSCLLVCQRPRINIYFDYWFK